MVSQAKTIRKILKKAVSASGRRHFKGAALGRLGFCTSWAVDIHSKNREWIEVVEMKLRLRNAGSVFYGRRIVHVSDLHCSRTVSSKYLKHCIDRINQLDADIVMLTGDYITHDINGRFRDKVIKLLGGIRSRYGVYACLGNHDYGIDNAFGSFCQDRLSQMIDGIGSVGVNVLRNDSAVLEIEGSPLWVVGLGDIWADDFEPSKAFAGVGGEGAVIALTHNPASVKHLEEFSFDAAMCGHTHGLKLQFAASQGRCFLNRHDYHAGMYKIGGKKLYVNRGLGRLGKILFNTRPEITVFDLC